MPTWSGANIGLMVKLGNLPDTNVDAAPRSMLANEALSPESGSVYEENLYEMLWFKFKVMSTGGVWNTGGPLFNTITEIGIFKVSLIKLEVIAFT